MTRTGLLFILVAFAGGGFIGFLGGSGSGDVVVSSGAKTDDSGPDTRPVPELAPMPNAPSSGYSSLEHALESIPYTPPKDGEGMFSGSVKTADGKPIAGVTVRATPRGEQKPHQYRQGSGVPDDPSLEEMVRRYVARTMEARKARRDAITDENGRFVIAGVADGKHYLQAYREGYAFQAAGNSNYNIEPGAEVEFTGRPLSLLEVRLTLPDGTEPEKAQVVAPTVQGHVAHLPWFPEFRTIELAPGTHAIHAIAGEFQEYKSSTITVEIALGVTPEPVQFDLKSRPGIRGKVAMPVGETNSSARVALCSLKAGEQPDEEMLRRSGKSTWLHSQNPRYTFLDLAPGTYAVGLSFDQRHYVAIETVTVKDDLVELDLEPPEPRREDYVLVHVIGPGGTPVQNMRFSAGYRTERTSRSSSTRVARTPDGDWRVWHYNVPEKDKEQGTVTYELTATSPQLGTKKVTYDRTPDSDVEIAFEEAGTLEVTIAGYAGSGREGKVRLAVQAARNERDSRSYWYSGNGNNQVDVEGKQTFTGLAPGPHEIVISIGGDRGRSTEAARVPITVKSGKNSETVTLPALYSLTVLVPGAEDGGNFSLRTKPKSAAPGAVHFRGYYGSSARVTAGKAVFENLAAGDYELRGNSGKTRGTMSVSVPGQTVVRFEPVQQDCLRVSIKSTTGRLAAAGLADGDLVVAIDGVELTDANQAMTLLRAAYVKPQAVLSLLRGRGRKEIPVDLRRSEGDPGGSFTPASR